MISRYICSGDEFDGVGPCESGGVAEMPASVHPPARRGGQSCVESGRYCDVTSLS